MPEGCGWKTSGGRKDEDERIRWEALRCHFGKGEREKQVTERTTVFPRFKNHKESLSVLAWLSPGQIVCCRDEKRIHHCYLVK